MAYFQRLLKDDKRVKIVGQKVTHCDHRKMTYPVLDKLFCCRDFSCDVGGEGGSDFLAVCIKNQTQSLIFQ
jgi:hypothetical protein